VSLYPYVMAHREYPVGMPQVLTREQFVGVQWTSAGQNPYRGLFKVRIAPPAPTGRREHVCLHRRTKNGALAFTLCGPCSDAQSPRCPHKTPAERSWLGGYTHVSLNRALDKGYTVLEIFEVSAHSSDSKKTICR
jgi:hypothetical protein